MRMLGRLLLLPFQIVGAVAWALTYAVCFFAHRPAGYLLRGDGHAFTRTRETYLYGTTHPFDDARFHRAWGWLWRPRFVAPKGPTEF